MKSKKQKKLTAKQIKELKKILNEKRNDLLNIVDRKKHKELPDVEVGDEIDTASMSIEKEMLFELTNNEKVMLDSIEAALRKIEKNKYGYCESCGKLITFGRLKTIPWARYCLTCQQKFEKPSE
jgi:DnaK suppressor protein